MNRSIQYVYYQRNFNIKVRIERLKQPEFIHNYFPLLIITSGVMELCDGIGQTLVLDKVILIDVSGF